MCPDRRLPLTVVLMAILIAALLPLVRAQQNAGAPAQPAGRAAAPAASVTPADQGNQVVIQREPIQLIDPETYKIPLQIEPAKLLEIGAPFDGFVRQVQLKSNDKAAVQSEAVRMENTVQSLKLQRAKAGHQAAQVELKLAKGSNVPEQSELAQAKLDAAKADLDLAQYELDRTSVRVPFAGEVLRVRAVDGQFVRAGEALLTVGDSSRMRVEIPLERSAAEPGKPLEIQIEDKTVQATIESVLPLNSRFEKLRGIFESITSAVVVVENTNGAFKTGQSVYVPTIPRQPVTELPASAVANTGDGKRKVQVIRENTIRDIEVRLLGPVGPDRMFVSGPFAGSDQVVTRTTMELADGTVLRAASAAATQAAAGTPAASGRPTQGAATQPKPAVGF